MTGETRKALSDPAVKYSYEVTKPDHVHICIEISPKYAVASVVGFLKGKSALAMARSFGGKERNFIGEHFCARGYAVSTVGFELEQVKGYIRDQDANDEAVFISSIIFSTQDTFLACLAVKESKSSSIGQSPDWVYKFRFVSSLFFF